MALPRDHAPEGRLPPWPVVDKRSTYQHPPAQSPPSPAPSYELPPRRTAAARRWIVVALVVVVLLALALWLLMR